jgi:uncharacterized protein
MNTANFPDMVRARDVKERHTKMRLLPCKFRSRKHLQNSFVLIFLFFVCLVLAPKNVFSQTPERRLALIIANESYTGAFGPLRNPKADAALIRSALQQAGFAAGDIVIVSDRDSRQMRLDIAEFSERLRAAGPNAVGLFYFAGHGIQKGGDGSFMLIPSREVINNGPSLEAASISLQDGVTKTLRNSGAATLIMIIDACRNEAGSVFRSTRGMDRLPPQVQGVFTLYSTDIAQVADDGIAGQASPFAQALARALPTPGVKISDLAQAVRREVAQRTQRRQVPTFVDGALDDFYFVRAVAPKPQTNSESSTAFQRWGLTQADFAFFDRTKILDKIQVETRIDELKTASADGEIEASMLLGFAYLDGRGVGPDPKRAVQLFKFAADRNNPIGMLLLGLQLERGEGIDQNVSAAAELYRSSATNGNASAAYQLGWILHSGRGIAENKFEGAGWLLRAAQDGAPRAMASIGVILATGAGIPNNDREAVRWFRQAIQNGDTDVSTMSWLAFMLNNGRGTEVNVVEAARWYLKAAEAGDVGAMYEYGKLAYEGSGIDRNYLNATLWFQRAADKNYGLAMIALGIMNEGAIGISKNEVEARRWYLLAAPQNDPLAQLKVARMMEEARGGPRDPRQALSWARAALARPGAPNNIEAQALIDKLTAEGVR